MKKEKRRTPAQNNTIQVEVLKLHVDADLYKAFQRCTWILINETGKNQIDIMNEMVKDFLIKHGC